MNDDDDDIAIYNRIKIIIGNRCLRVLTVPNSQVTYRPLFLITEVSKYAGTLTLSNSVQRHAITRLRLIIFMQVTIIITYFRCCLRHIFNLNRNIKKKVQFL